MFLTGQLWSLIEWTHSALKDKKKGGGKKNTNHPVTTQRVSARLIAKVFKGPVCKN